MVTETRRLCCTDIPLQSFPRTGACFFGFQNDSKACYNICYNTLQCCFKEPLNCEYAPLIYDRWSFVAWGRLFVLNRYNMELLAVSYCHGSILGIACWSPWLVWSLHPSSPWLSQNYCRQSGGFCGMDCCSLRSKKMQLNSFQVTSTLGFVLEFLSFRNIKCLKAESLSQEIQRSDSDLINQHITWLSLPQIQHVYFCLLLPLAWIISIAKDLNTAVFLTASMKLISCRCWLEAGSILHFQA